MESQLIAALSSGNAGQRKSALAELRNMGEFGAAQMGYHEQASSLLNDPDASVQVAAINALGHMGKCGAQYCDAIVARLRGSDQEDVKRASLQALGYFGEEASLHASVVEEYLDNENLDLVVEACIALGSMKATAAAGKVAAKLKDADVEVVIGACIGLGCMEAEVDALAGMLQSKEPRVRAASVGAMPRASAEKYLPVACALLADSDVYVRINATNLISSQGDKASAYVAEIGKHLGSSEVGVRVAAAAALGSMGAKAESQIEALEGLLTDAEEDTASLMMSIAGVQGRVAATLRKPACAAAAALGNIGGTATKSAANVAELLGSADYEVKISGITALGKMGEAGAKFEDQLVYLLDDPHPMVVGAACTAIGSIAKSTNRQSPAAASKMAELVKHTHPAVKGASLGGLGSMGEEAATFLEDFVKCFNDNVGYVRAQAIVAIIACGEVGQMYAAEICRLMFDDDVRVRVAAVKALPQMGERGAAFAEEANALLEDPMPEVRVASIKAFASFGGDALAEVMPFIKHLAEGDPHAEVRAAAREVMAGSTKALEE